MEFEMKYLSPKYFLDTKIRIFQQKIYIDLVFLGNNLINKTINIDLTCSSAF